MKDRPNNPLKARAQELGITLVDRDWIPSSRRAHECTEYARREGKIEPFHAGLLKAYWSAGKDIHGWGVLGEIASSAELDPVAMREAVEHGEFRTVVAERIEAGRDIGIAAVPTFVIDDRYMIQGAQTADTFERVLHQLATTPRT